MENDWLKHKVDLVEIEYINKLNDLRDYYEKKIQEGFEQAYQMLLAERARHKVELQEFKLHIVDSVDRFLEVKKYEEIEKMTAAEIVEKACESQSASNQEQ